MEAFNDLMEEVKGTEGSQATDGEVENRPDWLPTKFKNPQDLAESYKHLEKKLGSFSGAPEEYEVPETVQNKELASVLAKKGKELNMSQEAFNQILSEYDGTTGTRRSEFKKQLQSLDTVEKANVNQIFTAIKNTLGDSEAEVLFQKINSMDDIKVFEKIIKARPNTPSQSVKMREAPIPQSPEEFKKSIDRDRLYGLNGKQIDLKYRDEINAKYHEMYGSS